MKKAAAKKSTGSGDPKPGLGMAGGAAAGAAAGSLVGPVGAAVGAIVGGVAGANYREIAESAPSVIGEVKKRVKAMGQSTASLKKAVAKKKAPGKKRASKKKTAASRKTSKRRGR